MLIGQVQKEMMGAGFSNIVTPQHLYQTAIKIVETAGLPHHELFFQDPQSVPPPQPQPKPEEEFLKVQAQVEMGKLQLEQQKVELEKEKAVFEAQMAQQKAALEQAKLKLEAEKAALAGVTDGNRLELTKYQTDVKARGDAFKLKGDIIKETIKAKASNDKRPDSPSRN
jgi:hypothetical protein